MYLQATKGNSSLIHPQPIKPPPVAFIPFLSNSFSSPWETASSISGSVAVENVQSHVFVEMGRPLYTFSFSLYSTTEGKRTLLGTHKIVRPFDDFARLHDALQTVLGSEEGSTLPEYPHTKWLSFSTRLEILKQRQEILKEYFIQLLSCRAFLRSSLAHSIFHIPQRLSAHLFELGNQQ